MEQQAINHESIDQFLKRGGKINHIPTGETGLSEDGLTKAQKTYQSYYQTMGLNADSYKED